MGEQQYGMLVTSQTEELNRRGLGAHVESSLQGNELEEHAMEGTAGKEAEMPFGYGREKKLEMCYFLAEMVLAMATRKRTQGLTKTG
jgi:hypothetical protein